MSLLRIRASLADAPLRCEWALLDDGREPITGEGRLAELPQRADRVQLVISAAEVLITRARVPRTARRRAGAVLAFAVEEQTAGEPDANQASWLGAVGDDDVLAVVDKTGLTRWREALGAVGIRGYEIQCETLLLPWKTDAWGLAWDGREGYVRTGAFEGAATDRGDRTTPPQLLRLLLDEAKTNSAAPASIALYATGPDAVPDVAAWTRELGIPVHVAGTGDWRTAPPGAGVVLAQERQRWGVFGGIAARLRPAAWILGAALTIHVAALVIDWAVLANEQRALRQQMNSRFRSAFPDAVAVVDPALQMRRKLAEARHAAGQADGGDFLPMIAAVAAGTKGLPAGALKVLSYESGRMTLQLVATDEATVNRIVAELGQAGLNVERSPVAKREGGAAVMLTVRAS